MKLTHLTLVIGCIASLPLSVANAASPVGHPMPAPSMAGEVSYQVSAENVLGSPVAASSAECSTCANCAVETVSCASGVDCGQLGCGSCSPCGNPLGECNANCYCPQIKRRLYKIPCATSCCEAPRVGSVLIEALDAFRAHMYELKQTGFDRCGEIGCSDVACCDTDPCAGGLLSGGLLGRCFGATICDDGCSGGCGGSLGCTSCGDVCGGTCGGSCGVGFLGGGQLAGFLAACRSRFMPTCPSEGCGSYWGQFDGDCSDGGCSNGGCSDGGCSDGGCSNDFDTSWVPNSTESGPVVRSTPVPPAFAHPAAQGGLRGFLFPRNSQPNYASNRVGAGQVWNGYGDGQIAKTRPTSRDFSNQLEGNVQIVSTQDRRVGEPVVGPHAGQSQNTPPAVAATARTRVVQKQPIGRVGYHSQARRPGYKSSAAKSLFSR